MEKAESYGNIPEFIGFDPYIGWRWMCHRCGSQGAILEDHLPLSKRSAGLAIGESFGSCNACRSDKKKVFRKLSRAEAFHRNDIRFRKTKMNAEASIHGF